LRACWRSRMCCSRFGWQRPRRARDEGGGRGGGQMSEQAVSAVVMRHELACMHACMFGMQLSLGVCSSMGMCIYCTHRRILTYLCYCQVSRRSASCTTLSARVRPSNPPPPVSDTFETTRVSYYLHYPREQTPEATRAHRVLSWLYIMTHPASMTDACM
jgi:hypothetical protein